MPKPSADDDRDMILDYLLRERRRAARKALDEIPVLRRMLDEAEEQIRAAEAEQPWRTGALTSFGWRAAQAHSAFIECERAITLHATCEGIGEPDA